MKHKLSYKWHVFLYFLFFAAILVGILWLVETVFFEPFYRNEKRQELHDAMDETAKNIDEKDLYGITSELMTQYDLVITVTDGRGRILNSAEDTEEVLEAREFAYYYQEAEKNGGEVEFEIAGDARDDENPFLGRFQESGAFLAPGISSFPAFASSTESSEQLRRLIRDQVEYFTRYGQSILSIRLLENEAGESRMIVTAAFISPVSTTIATLRTELIVVSMIMLVVAFLLALFLSRYVTHPIVSMNETAKRLGEGHYDVRFEDGSFKELSELASTMNTTASELKKTENLRQELVANVSHDLRTPLTMIEAYAELMLDIPGEDNPENIQVIIDETKRLTLLVDNLLDISRLQADVVELNQTNFCLTDLITEEVGRKKLLPGSEDFTFTVEAEEPLVVFADRERIEQVLDNLLNNAINYSTDDKVVIVRLQKRGKLVRVMVEDFGVGISDEDLPYIFERYYRTDKNHTREVAGTGLGLSIVKRIMDLHKMECGVTRKEGNGSIFWFELPLSENREEDARDGQ